VVAVSRRISCQYFLTGLLLAALCNIGCGGSNSTVAPPPPPPPPPNAQIQHIIVIVKENHSFDNFFGQFPGANGATSGQTSTGQTVPLVQASDTPYNCGHSWAVAHKDVNGGMMNGFDLTCVNQGAYVQYSPSQIPAYWQLAHTYALAEDMFATLEGPSFPNHSYMFAGNSNNAVDNPTNITSQQLYGWGCDAAAVGTVVHSINPSTNTDYYQPTCFTMTTMAEILDRARVNWRVYSPQPGTSGYVWNFVSYFSQLWHGQDRQDSVPNTQFLSDIANCQLPQVSWIIPPLGVSEHPPESVANGMNWTVQQINAVMNSTCGYWQHSVIVLTWDDWGGFYDHVPPPVETFFGFGIRVPLLMISPYSKAGYISHTLYSFDSINAFIEHTFHSGCLVADCFSTTNDLTDMLNLGQTPLSTIQLEALPAVRMKYPVKVDEQTSNGDDD
jgi:phospholipase C